jgi:hypothetical protein
MSNREKVVSLIDSVPDYQLDALYNAIAGIIQIMKEAEDDAFCLSLAEQAKNENDGIRYSMDEVLKELNLDGSSL